MELIGIVLVIAVIYALFQTFRTKKDLEDPIFQLKVEKYICEYAIEHGEPPPNHMMPEIYKKVRKELKEMGLR